MGGKRLTTEEFIRRSKEVHGDRYDYREVEYKNQLKKVKIFCKKHKSYFFQIPKIHLTGSGCADCGREKVGKITGDRSRSTKKQFVDKAIKIHGDKYGYSKVEYINNNTNVKIFCKKCKKYFHQTPINHLNKKRCSRCHPEKNKSWEINSKSIFVKESRDMHKNKYDYSDVCFTSIRTKVKILCRKHDKYFYQTPYNHLIGYGCPKCGVEKRVEKMSFSKEDFIKKATELHGKDVYDYSDVKYVNTKTKVKIRCLKHNKYFYQRPNGHLVGQGCPFCLKKYEGKTYGIIKDVFDDWDICNHKKIWDNYGNYHHKRYCDFWLEKDDIKVMIEYDGKQHYMPVRFNGMSCEKANVRFEEQQHIDKLDTKFCKENNIILHRIKYDEDKKQSIVELRDRVDNLWN